MPVCSHLVNFLKMFLLLLRKPFFFGFSSSAGLAVPGLELSADLLPSGAVTFVTCLLDPVDSDLEANGSLNLGVCTDRKTYKNKIAGYTNFYYTAIFYF